MDWIEGDWFFAERYRLSEEVQDTLIAIDAVSRAVLEARFYERLSYRAIAARFTNSVHPGSGEFAVKAALAVFEKEWQNRHYNIGG